MSAVTVTGLRLSWPCVFTLTNPHQIDISSTLSQFRILNTKLHRAHCLSSSSSSSLGHLIFPLNHHLSFSAANLSNDAFHRITETPRVAPLLENVLLLDLDPSTAKVAITFLGPFLSAFGFLFILRIVMSWYPKLPVEKFPYIIAYAPTEPLLVQTRKLIPPLAGVDVTPVVWFGLVSFLNEILVGPQGLLVLLSQQIN